MGREKMSVMRLISSKANSAEDNCRIRDKAIDYVLRSEARKKGLVYMNGINPADVKGSFGFFSKAAAKDDGRAFKHLVLSFGGTKLSWKKLLEVTKRVANYYGASYQTIAVVHDNIPERPHAHILVDTFNVSTEKKLSEGPKDFWQLVDHINKVFEDYEIPCLLQGKGRNQKPKIEIRKVKVVKDYNTDDNVQFGMIPVVPEYNSYVVSGNTNANMQPVPSSWSMRDVLEVHRFIYPEKYKK